MNNTNRNTLTSPRRKLPPLQPADPLGFRTAAGGNRADGQPDMGMGILESNWVNPPQPAVDALLSYTTEPPAGYQVMLEHFVFSIEITTNGPAYPLVSYVQTGFRTINIPCRWIADGQAGTYMLSVGLANDLRLANFVAGTGINHVIDNTDTPHACGPLPKVWWSAPVTLQLQPISTGAVTWQISNVAFGFCYRRITTI